MVSSTEAAINIKKIIESLKNFRSEKKFQKEVIKIMVMFLADAEIKHLREIFRDIDADHDGIIGRQELKEFFAKHDEYVNDDEIIQLIQSLHLTDPDRLSYTEFIAASIDKRFFLSKDRLRLIFQYFDLENNGAISMENIKEVFARSGVKVTQEQVRSMVRELDPNANLTEVS